MKRVRCKFVCVEMGQIRGWIGGNPFLYRFKFQAVNSGSDEDKAFFEATPSGQLEFQSVASQAFEVGKSYYLDITPAD